MLIVFTRCTLLGRTYARFYELGLTRDFRVIRGLTVVSVLSTSNLGLNWDKVNESYTLVDPGLNSD